MTVALCLLVLAVLVRAASSVKDNVLKSRHLNIVTAELPLVISVTRDKNGTVTGHHEIGYYLIDWLSRRLDFTYEFKVLDDFKFGEKINGSYDGLIGYIQRKESDIAVSAFSLDDDREVADFSHPWTVLDFGILIPFPEEQSKTWAALKPFLPQVWLSFGAVFVAMNVAILASAATLRKMTSKSSSLSSSVSVTMYLTGVLTAQGGSLSYRGKSFVFLATLWCFLAFVFVSVYSSLLTSFLITTKYNPVVDSLHELAQKVNTVPLYTFRSSTPENIFLAATSGDYKILGDTVRSRPEARKLSGPLCLREALANHGVCIDAAKPAEFFIHEDLEKTGKCRVSLAKETFFPIYLILLFQKNGPYTTLLNHHILWANDMGLTGLWFERQVVRPYKCLLRSTQETQNKPLGLNNLTSAFVIILIGIGFSCIAFLLELGTYHLRKPTKVRTIHQNGE